MILKIITPEKELFNEQIDQVTLPTQDGEITILPGHIALVSTLKAGEVLAKRSGQEIPLAISGGFLQVAGNEVTLLADTAEHVEHIIEERAQEARKRAEMLREEKQFDKNEYAALSGKIEKELARLKVVTKYRHRQHGGFTTAGRSNDNQS